MNNKQAYRINVENLVYAPLEKDVEGEIQYGEVKELSEAMQIQLTPSIASGALHGEGKKVSTITKLMGVTAVFDVTKIAIDVKADILGHSYEGGVLVESGSDLPKDIAVGYKVPQDVEGVAEYIWLLKGRAQPYGATVQQATDNINYSTDSLTVEFVARKADGAIKISADTANSEASEELVKEWFKKVPTEFVGVKPGEIE